MNDEIEELLQEVEEIEEDSSDVTEEDFDQSSIDVQTVSEESESNNKEEKEESSEQEENLSEESKQEQPPEKETGEVDIDDRIEILRSNIFSLLKDLAERLDEVIKEVSKEEDVDILGNATDTVEEIRDITDELLEEEGDGNSGQAG